MKVIPESKQEHIDLLVAKVCQSFKTFGQGSPERNPLLRSPISEALADEPPSFAMGVDVREVVQFILAESAAQQVDATKNGLPSKPRK